MQGLPRANDHLVKMRGLLLSVRVSALAVLTLSFGACSFRGFDSFMDGAAGQLNVTGGSTGDGGTPQNGGTAGAAGTGESSGGTGGGATGGKGGTGGTGGKAGTGGTGGTTVKEKVMPAWRFIDAESIDDTWTASPIPFQDGSDPLQWTESTLELTEGVGSPLGAMKHVGTGGDYKPKSNLSPALDVTNLVFRARVKTSDATTVTTYMKSGGGAWADAMKDGVKVVAADAWTVIETDLDTFRAQWSIDACDKTTAAENPCVGYVNSAFDETKVNTYGLKVIDSTTIWVDSVWFQPRGYKFDDPQNLGAWEKNVEADIIFQASDQTESGTGGSLEIKTVEPTEVGGAWKEGWILLKLPESYMDLRQLVLKARVKSLVGGSVLSKFYLVGVDDGVTAAASPQWGYTSVKDIGPGWSTVTLKFAKPDEFNTKYNPKRIARIGIKVAGHVLVDSLEFDLNPTPPPTE
jgi:hypothetical protein